MTRLFLRLLLVIYRGLPDWLVRNIVLLTVGLAFAAGLIFLTIRPALRRIRSTWVRRRG